MPKTKPSKTRRAPKNGPVVVTGPSVTPCSECGQPVTYPLQPGAASAALTAHYNAEHPGG